MLRHKAPRNDRDNTTKISRPTGAREVSRGSTQIYACCLAHLFGPITGSADHLTRRNLVRSEIQLKRTLDSPDPTYRIHLWGSRSRVVFISTIPKETSSLWSPISSGTLPITRPGQHAIKMAGIILRFPWISRCGITTCYVNLKSGLANSLTFGDFKLKSGQLW